MLLNGCKANSCGVITLINNNFEYDILDTFKDEDGNILQLLINFVTFKLNDINIYAPNRDSSNFFEKLLQLSQNKTADYLMICVDFNLVPNPSVECYNYTNINNTRARSKVIQMMNDLDLTDQFCYLKIYIECFSWRKKSVKAS